MSLVAVHNRHVTISLSSVDRFNPDEATGFDDWHRL